MGDGPNHGRPGSPFDSIETNVTPKSSAPLLVALVLILVVSGCDGANPVSGEAGSAEPSDQTGEAAGLLEGGLVEGCRGKDCIPALSDPPTASVSAISYLDSSSRVISVRFGETYLAVPHRILGWHEIVNVEAGGRHIAVTLCPLTGSSMTFDRSVVGNAEFGVSGLLFQDNLVMYDRRSIESLWAQMMRTAGEGPARGRKLSMIPSVVMSWHGFKELHPEGLAVTSNTGYSRNYSVYPYRPFAKSRPPRSIAPVERAARSRTDAPIESKERVLGIPDVDSGGVALPYDELTTKSGARVVRLTFDAATGRVVVFWREEFQAAMAFRSVVQGREMTFTAEDGTIRDRETGSTWSVEGWALSGPMEGARLEPIPNAYSAFWSAWEAFQPKTRLWTDEEAP